MAESALSLVERLRAALDRAERKAQNAIQGPWLTSDKPHLSPHVVYGTSPLGGERIVQVCNLEAAWAREHNAAFMTANDPAHVLRTVAAHRKILDRHVPDTVHANDPYCCWCGRHGDAAPEWPCPDVRDLAAIYFPEETTDEH